MSLRERHLQSLTRVRYAAHPSPSAYTISDNRESAVISIIVRYTYKYPEYTYFIAIFIANPMVSIASCLLYVYTMYGKPPKDNHKVLDTREPMGNHFIWWSPSIHTRHTTSGVITDNTGSVLNTTNSTEQIGETPSESKDSSSARNTEVINNVINSPRITVNTTLGKETFPIVKTGKMGEDIIYYHSTDRTMHKAIFGRPGIGKTRRYAIQASKGIVSGPTRVVARELHNAFRSAGKSSSLNIKGATRIERRSQQGPAIMPHAVLVQNILDPQIDEVVVDESHFENLAN